MSGAEQADRSAATASQLAASVLVPALDVPGLDGVTNDGGTQDGVISDNGLHVLRPVDPQVGDRTAMKREPVPAGLPSGVIHELRTPLTSIHGYAQVLQRMLRDDPKAANALAVVVRESTRLAAMLAELSELADLQSNEAVAEPIEYDVLQIVDGVVHEVTRRDPEGHPIAIDGSAMAYCNPTMLSQVLLHVLTNAIRYSPAGSPINVTIAPRGDTVEIAVEDRGIGIEPADDERVYEAFERGANARRAGIRGLGLGLFLAARALETMGGQIRHERPDAGGTVVRITVPGV